MKLVLPWSQLVVVFGLLLSIVKGLPLDLDSMKDAIQLGAMAGLSMTMDAMENMKGQVNHNREINVGPVNMKSGFGASAGNVDKDKDRKRRRRSVDEVQFDPSGELRYKRSPCKGRRRGASSTVTPPAGGAGEAGAGAGGPGGELDDIRRRRKRSPQDDNDVDENLDIVPFQKKFADRTQEIGESIRQMMKSMLEAMNGAIESLKKSIQNGLATQN